MKMLLNFAGIFYYIAETAIMNNSEAYRKLQKHLDSMPVPYPSVSSGRDIKVLENFFDVNDIPVALAMDFQMRSISEIAERSGISDIKAVEKSIESMLSKGAILYRQEGDLYSLVPLVVGMYEFQVNRLNSSFLSDFYGYLKEKFAFQFLTTAIPQTRIIPVNETVSGGSRISTYDEYREMIKSAGDRIVVIECICRKVQDMEGDPCSFTDRRELCLALRDYADTAVRQGWGRKISVEEALEIAELNRKERFVFQSANDKNPNFICACCSDCCGLINMIKAVPYPAEYVDSSYICEFNGKDKCRECGLCMKRCPMDALELRDNRIKVDLKRCIGCGLCVDSCNFGLLNLRLKKICSEPHNTVDDLYLSFKGKRNYGKKLKLVLRYIAWKLKLIK